MHSLHVIDCDMGPGMECIGFGHMLLMSNRIL